jgi:hypothetical protein
MIYFLASLCKIVLSQVVCCILATQEIMLKYKNCGVNTISLLIFQAKNNVCQNTRTILYVVLDVHSDPRIIRILMCIPNDCGMRCDNIIVLDLNFDFQMSKSRDRENSLYGYLHTFKYSN